MENNVSSLIKDSTSRLVGLKQVLRGISDGKVRCVILASDTDDSIKSRIKQTAADSAVKLMVMPSKAELGEMVGIDVDCAVVGIIE